MNRADLNKNLEALSTQFLETNGKIAALLQDQLVVEANTLRARLDAKEAQLKRLEEERALRIDNLRIHCEELQRTINGIFEAQCDILRTEAEELSKQLIAVIGNS